MIVVGSEFTQAGKLFAYAGQKQSGSIIAYRLSDMSLRRFPLSLTMSKLEGKLNGKVNEVAAKAYKETQEDRNNKRELMYTMTPGQHFIGRDNKEYIFKCVRRTRFSLTSVDNNNEYNAKPGFIKTVLGTVKKEKVENPDRPEGSEHCPKCWGLHMPDEFGKDELCEDCEMKYGVKKFSEL